MVGKIIGGEWKIMGFLETRRGGSLCKVGVGLKGAVRAKEPEDGSPWGLYWSLFCGCDKTPEPMQRMDGSLFQLKVLGKVHDAT